MGRNVFFSQNLFCEFFFSQNLFCHVANFSTEFFFSKNLFCHVANFSTEFFPVKVRKVCCTFFLSNNYFRRKQYSVKILYNFGMIFFLETYCRFVGNFASGIFLLTLSKFA